MIRGLLRQPAGAPEAEALARVQPALPDLVALRAAARGLPPLARAAQTRRHGPYSAPMKGRGMEYVESRPYQPGDDIRALDWRLTARSGRPHTKLFQEERDRPVCLGIDLRASMAFATRGVFKSVLAARTAALLAWKTVETGDRLGSVLLADAGPVDLPPARGQVAALRVLKRLVLEAGRRGSAEPERPGLDALAARLARLTRPGSLVFVLGDFRDLAAAEADFARLAAHSDVMFIACEDPFEQALPALPANLRVTDGRLRALVGLDDDVTRQRYAARATARADALTTFCRSHRIRLLRLATDADPVVALRKAAP